MSYLVLAIGIWFPLPTKINEEMVKFPPSIKSLFSQSSREDDGFYTSNYGLMSY